MSQAQMAKEPRMLEIHFGVVEKVLLASAEIAASAGHKGNRGAPREAFIREFLAEHLSPKIQISTGEVIDSASRAGDDRPQLDIVLHDENYPVVTLGGDITAVLAESVIATIEVKSQLDADAIEQAAKAARYVKGLSRNVETIVQAGYTPPSVLSFLVAYRGPKDMVSAFDQMSTAHAKLGIKDPKMPLTLAERGSHPSPALDGIFVLGKGFILFDNTAFGVTLPDESRKELPNSPWIIVDQEGVGGLFTLFMILTLAVSGSALRIFQPGAYLKGFQWGKTRLAAVKSD